MMPELLITSGIILVLLVLSGFFSGSETALTAASRPRMHSLSKRGDRRAAIVLALRDRNERLIGGILLGNNLTNILATSLATAIFTRAFGDSGVALATLVMTLLVLIFAEVLPKTYSINEPELAAARTAPLIGPIITMLSPIVTVVQNTHSPLPILSASSATARQEL